MYKRGRNEKALLVQDAQGETRKNFFIFSLKIVHFEVDFGFQSMLQCERREDKGQAARPSATTSHMSGRAIGKRRHDVP